MQQAHKYISSVHPTVTEARNLRVVDSDPTDEKGDSWPILIHFQFMS